MDFQSAMETFAEAWVAANAGQQSQALALTRVANAAAAAAANAANVKTPTDTLHSEVIVKKEHSPSPSHSRHTPINNAASTSLMASNTSHVPNDGSPPTPTQQHRRNSLQGVQDKLAQLHQLQQQQQQQQQQQKFKPAYQAQNKDSHSKAITMATKTTATTATTTTTETETITAEGRANSSSINQQKQHTKKKSTLASTAAEK